MRYLYSLIPLFLLILTACEAEQGARLDAPNTLLEDFVYIPLLAEMQLLQVWSTSTDTLDLEAIKRDVFNRYGVKEVDFEQTHRYNQSDYTRQRARLDSVKLLIEAEKRRIQGY